MKRCLFAILFVCLSSVGFADELTWEWGTSESAENFERIMEDRENGGILYSNFPLTNWTITINDANEFTDLVNDRSARRDFIADRVFDIGIDLGMQKSRCYSARAFLETSWVDEIDSGFIASYQFAIVFMKFDEDNWFSFDSVRERTYTYLGEGSIVFRLYKGFYHNGVLSNGGISMEDLPIVIDKEEQTITIWSGELYD